MNSERSVLTGHVVNQNEYCQPVITFSLQLVPMLCPSDNVHLCILSNLVALTHVATIWSLVAVAEIQVSNYSVSFLVCVCFFPFLFPHPNWMENECRWTIALGSVSCMQKRK